MSDRGGKARRDEMNWRWRENDQKKKKQMRERFISKGEVSKEPCNKKMGGGKDRESCRKMKGNEVMKE